MRFNHEDHELPTIPRQDRSGKIDPPPGYANSGPVKVESEEHLSEMGLNRVPVDAELSEDWPSDACRKPRPVNPKVPDRLTKLGDIYRERNATYGDTYKNFGFVMKSFFRESLTLTTVEDWNRIGIFFHLADKLARYSASFPRGVVGHVDSLDDLSVYSQMLQEYDQDVRNDTQPK